MNLRIRKIDSTQADEIIDNRLKDKNRGYFYLIDGDCFVGFDNATGDCWVEEFNDLRSCIKWLRGW